jgi:hypothetical protein
VVHIFVIELVPPKFPDRDSIRNDLPPFHPPPHHHQQFERYGDVFPFFDYGLMAVFKGISDDIFHRDGAVPLRERGKRFSGKGFRKCFMSFVRVGLAVYKL